MKTLTKWERPNSYMGSNYYGYYVAVSYEGLENAYVDKEAIRRLVESKYPPYDSLTENLFYKLCKVA